MLRPIRLRMASLLSRARRKVALAPVSTPAAEAASRSEDQDAALSHAARGGSGQREGGGRCPEQAGA